MLNVMRENLKHLKWVLYIVAISMTLYLGTMFDCNRNSGGASADWAARVNGTEISSRDFVSATRNIDNYYSNLLGDQFEQLKPQLRMGSMAIQQLIVQQIQLDEAKKLGFKTSDRELADLIRNDTRFQDESGNFVGAEKYKNYFQRQWVGGVEAFEQELAMDLVSRKWADLVGQAVYVSSLELEDAYRQRNEKTRIRYLVVQSADQQTGGPVPEESIQQWYDTHQDDYMQGVRRKIRYVLIDRRAELEGIEVTDEQIETYYNDHQDSFQTGEQRRASHILFQVPPTASPEERAETGNKAQEALNRIQAGESIADLAPELSADRGSAANGGDLGFFGRGKMIPAFEQAAFNTPVGELADVVQTDFGFHVIQVTGAREAGTRPLDEAREEIRSRISLDTAQDLIREKAENIAEGATAERFAEIVQQAGLEMTELTATATDRMTELAPTPEFRREMFALQVGSVSAPLGVARGMAVIVVDEELQPAVSPLEEVRAKVESAVRNDLLAKEAMTAAEKAFGNNRDLDRAAISLDQEVQDSGDLAPGSVNLPGAGGSTPELRAALFDDTVTIGDRGVVQVPAGALIYEVTDRTAFDPVAFQAARTDLESELLMQKRQNFMQAVINRLMEEYTIEINNEMVATYDS